jgi:dienelactone hydrolase
MSAGFRPGARVMPGNRLRRWCAACFSLCLIAPLVSAASASATEPAIPFTLTKPAGDGPFPAVVILHDCSGLGPQSSGGPWRWATRLTEEGYVTIWPDSFQTRGHRAGVCTDTSPPRIPFTERAADAYAALVYLRTLPYVDPRRVAVMGGSHGGSSTLAAIVDTAANKAQRGPGFAAAIALYPGCGRSVGGWQVERDSNRIAGYSGVFKPLAPLLILIGELDDWTPAEPCRKLAAMARQAGYPVEIEVYPGAYHAFDSRAPVRFIPNRINSSAEGGRGATTGGNSEAWAAAIVRVKAFLEKHVTGG